MPHTQSGTPDVEIRGFPPHLFSELEEIVEHFNGRHDDTVLFIARFAGAVAGAEAAEIVGLTPTTLTVATRERGAEKRVDLPFAQEIASPEQLQTSMMAFLARSRREVGDRVPPTSIERELAHTRHLPTHVSRVARTKRITPNLQEITFRGGLEGFVSIAPDQFVYVLVEKPGQTDVIREGVTMAGLRSAPEAERPAAAYYTVRRHRADVGEMDLWFVLHGHSGGMSGWAATANEGDRAAVWGPRSGFEPPEDTTELLLLGDETALPAIAAILEANRLPARVVLETVDEAHTVELPQRANVTIDWVFRGTTPAQESNHLVEGVERASPTWIEGRYGFGAAEAGRTTAVRRYLRSLGAEAARLHLTPYWRSGRALNG